MAATEAPRAYTVGSGPTAGYRLNAATASGEAAAALFGQAGSFRLLLSPESPVELRWRGRGRVLAAPCLAWIGEGPAPELRAEPGRLRALAFHPDLFNNRYDYGLLRRPEGLSVSESQDLYFLNSFLEADAGRPGALERAYAEAPALLRQWQRLDSLLAKHDFDGWPCQARAVVIEMTFALRHLDAGASPAGPAETGDELAGRVAFAIQSRLGQRLGLAALAREFATNRTSLNERFHAAFGCGVAEFQRAARLRSAQAMLKDTGLPLESIMERTGYRDKSAFVRAFRGHAGCTPADYRNRYSWMVPR